MQVFDTTGGEPFKGKIMKIDLTNFGVVGEKGEDLQPANNPHDVSEGFGRLLIATGRATPHVPKAKPEEPKTPPAGVQNRDPKATNRDPR